MGAAEADVVMAAARIARHVAAAMGGRQFFDARSLAQAICGWTRPPRPQSAPAMTFSLPTTSAHVMMRSATSFGYSTRSVGWLTTLG